MSEIFTHIVYDGSFKKGKRSSFNKEIASKFLKFFENYEDELILDTDKSNVGVILF